MNPHPMDAIPNRQREIVELTCDQDLSNPEIAYLLGVTIHTIKNQKTSIIQRFEATTMHKVCREYGIWKERNDAREVIEAFHANIGMRADSI